MIISDIIYNLSLLLALCVLSGFLYERYDSSRLSGRMLQGLLFGGIAVVGMIYPFVYREGIFFDGRTVVVSLATLFFGPVAGGISAGIAGLYRLSLGGGGMFTGLFTIATSFLIGWAFFLKAERSADFRINTTTLLVFGFLVHLVMLLLMITLPAAHIREAMATLGATILTAYPFITVLIGKIFLDQRHRKADLLKLKESELKFRLLVESTEDIIFTLDTSLKHTGIYGNWLEHFGLNRSAFRGKTAVEILGEERGRWHEEKFREALQGQVVEYEWEAESKQGKICFQTKLSPIRNPDNIIIGLVGVGRNITALKKAQSDLAKSVDEKNVLLAEIHHRVKNNMAIISSLVTLQTEHAKYPGVKELLLEAENRVRSMALVHEIVYEHTNFSEIDFSELLRRLVGLLSSSYNMPNRNIHVEVEAEEIFLDINKSVPTTLLVNELITNAFKHAFDEKKGGNIRIRFSRNNGRHELAIEDTGTGVEDIEGLNNPVSFGYTIIHGLVQQLQGTIRFENMEQGFLVTVRF